MESSFFLLLLSGLIIILCGTVYFYNRRMAALRNEMRVYKKELTIIANHTAEIERERIVKDLHDDVGSLLTVIKLHLTKIARNPADKLLMQELITNSSHLIDESIQNLRNISGELIPLTFLKCGYEKGIAEICRQLSISGEINITVTCSENEVRLSPLIELYVYRITREILNNVIKHSKATEMQLHLNSTAKGVIAVIYHNGTGITSEDLAQRSMEASGIGFKSIQNRLDLINASAHFEKTTGDKFKITIEVPAYEEND